MLICFLIIVRYELYLTIYFFYKYLNIEFFNNFDCRDFRFQRISSTTEKKSTQGFFFYYRTVATPPPNVK